MAVLFQFNQKVGLASSKAKGLGRARACRSSGPPTYPGAQVRVAPPPPLHIFRVRHCHYPLSDLGGGVMHIAMCARNQAKCHSGMSEMMSSGGVANGGFLEERKGFTGRSQKRLCSPQDGPQL